MAGLTEGLQKVEGRAQRTGGSEQKGSEMGEVRKAEFLEAAAVCFFPPPPPPPLPGTTDQPRE